MTKSILHIIGLQRAGNHAVIDWIRSLFGETAFYNNRPHDLFATPEIVAQLQEATEACLIVSMEDSQTRFAADGDTIADIVPPSSDDFPDRTCRTLYVLRDPYNNWASRVRAHESRGLTSAADLDHFIENWLHIAERWLETPDSVILYNRWKTDAAYRRAICKHIGGTYSEVTLDQVSSYGGGSSFDKHPPRPTYAQMLRRLPRYFSREFVQRLRRAPRRVLVRLITPVPVGSKLPTDARWPSIVDREDCRPLFEDPRIARASHRIFGFWVDARSRSQSFEAPGI